MKDLTGDHIRVKASSRDVRIDSWLCDYPDDIVNIILSPNQTHKLIRKLKRALREIEQDGASSGTAPRV